jgi:hypothetical protein
MHYEERDRRILQYGSINKNKNNPNFQYAPKFDIDNNYQGYERTLTFPPCPFFIRYQREDERDEDSAYFLNDYNVTHSHPLDLSFIYIEKCGHVDRLAQTYMH